MRGEPCSNRHAQSSLVFLTPATDGDNRESRVLQPSPKPSRCHLKRNRRAVAQFLVRFSGLRIMLSHGTWLVFARHSPHGFLLWEELVKEAP